MTLMYILGAVAVLLTAIFIFVRVTKGGLLGVYTKTLASVGFMALGVFALTQNITTTASLFIIIGMLFGLIGDIVLDLKVVYKNDNDSHLNAGMTSFFLGHIMYFIALTLTLNNYGLGGKVMPGILIAAGIAGLLTIGIMYSAKPLLQLEFGNFKIQTAAYTFVLTFMTAYAFYAGIYASYLLIFAVGLLLFFLSDLVLSNQYFGGKADSKILTIINHALYYLAQITIAVMLYFI